MKNNILTVILLSLFISSCGKSKNDKAEETSEQKEIAEVIKDCNCSELKNLNKMREISKTDSKDLFTGVCTEKDQFDSITRKIEVKNGWLIKELQKEKIANNYVTLKDVTYENEEYSNGFIIQLYEYSGTVSTPHIYVKNYKEYKNGKIFNEWKIEYDDAYFVAASWFIKSGVESKKGENQPECMKGSETGQFAEDTRWLFRDISPKKYKEIGECLKKEFPEFNDWKTN